MELLERQKAEDAEKRRQKQLKDEEYHRKTMEVCAPCSAPCFAPAAGRLPCPSCSTCS